MTPSSVIRSRPSTANPKRPPSSVSRGTLPAALWPNVKFRPDHDLRGVQPVHEHLVGERVGRHVLHLRGERQHAERVDPLLGDQLGAAAEAGQPGGMAARADDLRGVRVERDEHRGQPARPPALDRPADQLLVPAVHAVEHADRDDAAAPTRRYGLQTPPTLHARAAYAERLCEPRPRPVPRGFSGVTLCASAPDDPGTHRGLEGGRTTMSEVDAPYRTTAKPKRTRIHHLREMKERGERWPMLTAYDHLLRPDLRRGRASPCCSSGTRRATTSTATTTPSP